MIDRIENYMNSFTDRDWSWWPVLFLRPAKTQDIDNMIVWKLSFIFGPIIGVGWWATHVTNTGSKTLGSVLFFVLIACLFFFAIYKITFAYFWNRRARRLRGG
jgi:hypothetical protein